MNLETFAIEVHDNAVKHGFWEKTDLPTQLALVHAEWSEALEEYRAGRPMVWYDDKKPEGVAIELIDGCLRILDLLGYYRHPPVMYTPVFQATALPELVTELHLITSNAWQCTVVSPEFLDSAGFTCLYLSKALYEVLDWVKAHGCDAESLLKEKHEYNLTRPYMHGKKI